MNNDWIDNPNEDFLRMILRSKLGGTTPEEEAEIAAWANENEANRLWLEHFTLEEMFKGACEMSKIDAEAAFKKTMAKLKQP